MQEPKLIDIYPVVGKSFEYYFSIKTILLGVGLFVLLFGVLGALAYYLYRYYTSAHNRARRDLKRLKNEPCATQAQAKEAISHVSHIVRRFLIQKYSLSSTGMTDAELISFLKTKTSDRGIIKAAEQLLLATQHVRFSHERTQAVACQQARQEAERFVAACSRGA